jgi:autotransporter-associated beta strand protein
MFPRLSPVALLLFISTQSALADTFTWSGNTGNFSDPASWVGPAPLGSPTDELVFPAPIYPPYTAAIDSPQPWTLNSLTVSGNAYDSPILAANPGSGLHFDGANPTISSTANSNLVLNTPITTTSSLTFSNIQANLSGPLSSSDPTSSLNIQGAALQYQSNTPPIGFAQTVLASATYNSSLAWTLTLPDSSPQTFSFGPGPIIFEGGTFNLNTQAPAGASAISVSLSNPLRVQGSAHIGGSTSSPVASATYEFSGPISLGGMLVFDSFDSNTSAQVTYFIASNTISLDQSTTSQPTLAALAGLQFQRTIIMGNIVDDPNPAHTARQPLDLVTDYYGYPSDFIIAGTHNTYSTGTVIEIGTVTVASGSSLGTGPITVYSGTLRLSTPANLQPGQTVDLTNPSSSLSITFDQSPYTLLAHTASGVLALDTTFTTTLDESLLGNGLMAIGSSDNETYAATSLRPGSDHVYRLSAPIPNQTSPTLTLVHSVLVDYDGVPSKAELGGVILAASNSYSGGTSVLGDTVASVPGALGTGDITIGVPPYAQQYPHLYLSAPNTYASTAQVDVYGTLAAIGTNGSIPLSDTPPILHPGSALVLGDNLTNNSDRYPDSMPIHLDSSSLILKGTGITTETVGPISISGLSTIVLWNPSTGSHTTTLVAPSLAHDDHSVLFIEPYQQPLNTDDSDFPPFSPIGANNVNLRLNSPPPVTHGMVPPWIQSREQSYNAYGTSNVNPSLPSFLTYTSNGFAAATYTSMPTSGGTGTEIVDVSSADGSPVPLAANTSIYALRTSANIANPASGPVTLRIAGGGLIATVPNAGFSPSFLIEPNIDFANAEAFINTQGSESFGDPQIFQISGVVTATHGLTKFGSGTLRLTNPDNQITGPITLLEGTLDLAALPEPDSADPIRVSTGTVLNFLNSTVLSRPITIVPGNNLLFMPTISASPGQTLTLAAPIIGNAELLVQGGALAQIAAPINYSAGIMFENSDVHLSSPISALWIEFDLGPNHRVTGSGVITSSTGFSFREATLSPGDNPGDLATITFNATQSEFAAGAILVLDLDSAGHSDHLLATGALTIDPPNEYYDTLPTALSLNFLSPPTGETYTLLSAASLTGTFGTVSGLPDGYSLEYTPTSLLLVPTASLPEPATFLPLGMSLPWVLRRRGKRRRHLLHRLHKEWRIGLKDHGRGDVLERNGSMDIGSD